ncbi:MAG: sugar phosphate isomerase/epimerase [Sedimentisphaerales bacterium]|nr:sugar phosphate isomerase/epimerase [Sedimentisphaerales bacterium]
MAHYNRRTFVKATTGLLGAATLGSVTGGCLDSLANKEQWKGFKYAMCNESMRELPWNRQCKIVSDAGYKGIEIAAFTLVQEGVGEITPDQRKEMVQVMSDNGLECVGLHWLLAPPPQGLHFTTPDAATREKTTAYLNELIDFCGDLGGTVMIFGSPKQRNTVGPSTTEAKKYFAEGLAKVANHAKKRKIKILIEPLDHTQTDVINTTAEAMEIAKKINHPAIQTMFDFHNTVDEKDDFVTLLKTYRQYIHHVHVMEMDGKHLGTGDAVNRYVDAFQYLKDIRYDKWVSLEVFDFTPGGRVIAEESMKVLKAIEAKLV